MCWHEVLEYVKTLTEAWLDRKLDCTTCCISHESSHTCKLFDLLIRSTGSGICHHEDVVVLIKTCKKCLCKGIICILPCLDNLFVTLLISDKSTLVLSCNLIYSVLCISDHLWLLWWHCHIWNWNCHGSLGWILVSHSFDIVKNLCCCCSSVCVDNLLKDLLDLFLTNVELNLKLECILSLWSVYKTKILWNVLIEYQKTYCCLCKTWNLCAVRKLYCTVYKDILVKSNLLVLVSEHCKINTSIVTAEKIYRSAKHTTVSVCNILKPDEVI